eukprot:Skav233677  [mRNA]  locus=scaffold1927:60376:60770:- [translate_table: standard]
MLSFDFSWAIGHQVVLNHSGTILKRFEPGELVELTVQEAGVECSDVQVLTAAKTDEFGDSDSRRGFVAAAIS